MRDHLATAVSLVRQNFAHRKVSRSLLKQRLELGNVVAVAVSDRDAGYDMRFHAYHRVNLDVVADVYFMPVFRGVVPIETLQSEAGRIGCEIGFDRAERQTAGRDEVFNDGRDFRRLDHVEDRVIAGRVRDQSLGFGFVQVSHKSSRGNRRINLECSREQGVSNRQARATALLLDFGNPVAQIAEQVAERALLGSLGSIVRGPVLRIGDTHCRGDSFGSVSVIFTLHGELDCECVLALDLPEFVVWASALIAVRSFRDGVFAVQTLRRHYPLIALLDDSSGRRDFHSTLLSSFHVRHPMHRWYIQIVYPCGGTCQYQSYILLVDTRGIDRWQKTRKSEWSSWTVADADAGMNGLRAATNGQLSVRSANRLDGTSQNPRLNRRVESYSQTSLYRQVVRRARRANIGHAELVGPSRLELETRSFADHRSTCLSYGPAKPFLWRKSNRLIFGGARAESPRALALAAIRTYSPFGGRGRVVCAIRPHFVFNYNEVPRTLIVQIGSSTLRPVFYGHLRNRQSAVPLVVVNGGIYSPYERRTPTVPTGLRAAVKWGLRMDRIFVSKTIHSQADHEEPFS